MLSIKRRLISNIDFKDYVQQLLINHIGMVYVCIHVHMYASVYGII